MSKSIFVFADDLGVAGVALPWYRSLEEAKQNGATAIIEYSPVPPWILVSDRLPEPKQIVEYIRRATPSKLSVGEYDPRDPAGIVFTFIEEILCWRPARPIGELPQPKEAT